MCVRDGYDNLWNIRKWVKYSTPCVYRTSSMDIQYGQDVKVPIADMWVKTSSICPKRSEPIIGQGLFRGSIGWHSERQVPSASPASSVGGQIEEMFETSSSQKLLTPYPKSKTFGPQTLWSYFGSIVVAQIGRNPTSRAVGETRSGCLRG